MNKIAIHGFGRIGRLTARARPAQRRCLRPWPCPTSRTWPPWRALFKADTQLRPLAGAGQRRQRQR